ncbi:MAG: hypothetical protein GXP09_04755 [Gammaproteobacteria bacterium]|nr:hypothetical protein [Gammaproteobacteria bacterium]
MSSYEKNNKQGLGKGCLSFSKVATCVLIGNALLMGSSSVLASSSYSLSVGSGPGNFSSSSLDAAWSPKEGGPEYSIGYSESSTAGISAADTSTLFAGFNFFQTDYLAWGAGVSENKDSVLSISSFGVNSSYQINHLWKSKYATVLDLVAEYSKYSRVSGPKIIKGVSALGRSVPKRPGGGRLPGGSPSGSGGGLSGGGGEGVGKLAELLELPTAQRYSVGVQQAIGKQFSISISHDWYHYSKDVVAAALSIIRRPGIPKSAVSSYFDFLSSSTGVGLDWNVNNHLAVGFSFTDNAGIVKNRDYQSISISPIYYINDRYSLAFNATRSRDRLGIESDYYDLTFMVFFK